MLIRISLIVAILAGLAVAGIALFPLKDNITSTIAARDEFNNKWKQETAKRVTAEKNLADTKTKLDSTTKELASTKTERDSAKAAEAEAVKKADDLQTALTKTQGDLKSSQDKLAAWEVLGIPLAQARDILTSLKRVTEEKDALEAEKAIIYAKAKKLQAQLDDIVGKNHDPELPDDLSGKVVVVDPKFDFVVLNVGQKQGVLPKGKLLVHRNGKLVAKLVVTDTITDNQCVANVMPNYQQSDIMEGDQVFPANPN